eukprot:3395205-Rhodomonas_salina.1
MAREMSGAVCAAIGLRACYAKPGTDIAKGRRGRRSVSRSSHRTLALRYRPTRLLRDARAFGRDAAILVDSVRRLEARALSGRLFRKVYVVTDLAAGEQGRAIAAALNATTYQGMLAQGHVGDPATESHVRDVLVKSYSY